MPELVPAGEFQADFSHPAFQSGFLAPVPPDFTGSFSYTVPNDAPTSNVASGDSAALPAAAPPAAAAYFPMSAPQGVAAPPSAAAYLPMSAHQGAPLGYPPAFGTPQPSANFPTSAPFQTGPVPNLGLLVESLQQVNMELVVKLERSQNAVRQLEKDRLELLDRLEKSLKVSVSLKSVESENGELRANFRKSEVSLRTLYDENKDLKTRLSEAEDALMSLRTKYFAERERNNELSLEMERVVTVSELAKQALDSQSSKAELRDLQVRTMRSLIDEGQVVSSTVLSRPLVAAQRDVTDELDMAAAMYDQATHKAAPSINSLQSSLTGVRKTEARDWYNTPVAPAVQAISSEARSILLSGSSTTTGLLFNDRFLSLHYESCRESDGVRIRLVVTNQSPSIVQQVRVQDCSRPTSAYQFILSVKEPVWLKPGQAFECIGTVSVLGVFDFAPVVSLSYLPSDGIPINRNISLPIVMAKLLTPVRPAGNMLVSKWDDFSNSEIVWKWSQGNIASLVSLGELGGNLFYQRGIDPNPRGLVFAGALPGNPVQEVIVRIEQTPSDQPPMVRVTVRSPSISLSKSIATTMTQILQIAE